MPSLEDIPCPDCKKNTLRIVNKIVRTRDAAHQAVGEALRVELSEVPTIQCACGFEQRAKPCPQ